MSEAKIRRLENYMHEQAEKATMFHGVIWRGPLASFKLVRDFLKREEDTKICFSMTCDDQKAKMYLKCTKPGVVVDPPYRKTI